MPEEAKTRFELALAVTLFAALAIVGCVAGALVVNDFSRARSSVAWRVVDAVVLSADDGIRYAYSFEGRSFEARRVRFFTAGALGSPIAAQEPGDTIGAYVNPDEPWVAVLAPGGSPLLFGSLVAVAAVMVFVGLGGLVRTVAAAAEAERNGDSDGNGELSVDAAG